MLLDGTMKDEYIDILQKIATISPDSECNLGVDDFFDVTPTHKPSLQNINNFMVNANLSNSELLNFDDLKIIRYVWKQTYWIML